MPKKKSSKPSARQSSRPPAPLAEEPTLFALPDLPEIVTPGFASLDPDTASAQEVINAVEEQLQQLNDLMTADLPEVDHDALDRANELFMAALEARTPKARLRRAREALAACPECADAWLLLSRELDLSPPERLIYLERALDAGRAIIGKAYGNMIGVFWGFHETRPYMRVMEAHARYNYEQGLLDEAIVQWEAMLNLNPNDNQGVRDPLASAYLEANRLDEAANLLNRYEEDESAALAYARALLAYLRHGDTPASRQARKQALASNPHLARFLSGAQPLPPERPDSYQLGSREEAILVADHATPAWQKHPAAIAWLAPAASA